MIAFLEAYFSQPAASLNGGPATQFDDWGVGEGPPPVS